MKNIPHSNRPVVITESIADILRATGLSFIEYLDAVEELEHAGLVRTETTGSKVSFTMRGFKHAEIN